MNWIGWINGHEMLNYDFINIISQPQGEEISKQKKYDMHGSLFSPQNKIIASLHLNILTCSEFINKLPYMWPIYIITIRKELSVYKVSAVN